MKDFARGDLVVATKDSSTTLYTVGAIFEVTRCPPDLHFAGTLISHGPRGGRKPVGRSLTPYKANFVLLSSTIEGDFDE